MDDLGEILAEQVRAAARDGTPLTICGGGSKDFLGRLTQGEALDVTGHRGVVSYEPTELVITARAGTPLAELEQALAESGQMLPFEPPHFGPEATIGGAVASGLSGPRRPYAGSARDHVLGTRLLNGRGENLRFGGQVMKNVAGYDVSRLMCGAMGTLGVLLEISLKVLPRPAVERTLVFELDEREAIERVNAWAGAPVPLSGAFHAQGRLHVRLSGTANGVESVVAELGGRELDGPDPWADLREHRLAFFRGESPLWRLSVPPATAPLELPGETLVDWGGAQRWLRGDADPEKVRAAASTAGGHATAFRGGERTGHVFAPLGGKLLELHQGLKSAFDPAGILNHGRMYEGL